MRVTSVPVPPPAAHKGDKAGASNWKGGAAPKTVPSAPDGFAGGNVQLGLGSERTWFNFPSTFVGRIREPRFAFDTQWISLPLSPENAHIVFSIAVPITNDGTIHHCTKLNPHVSLIPTTVAV